MVALNSFAGVFVLTSALVVIGALSFTGWLFIEHPAGYTEQKYAKDRAKRNVAPPPDLDLESQGVLSMHMYGGPAWDDYTLTDYQTYGFSSALGPGIPADRVTLVDFDDDATCTTDICDAIGAKVEWRGKTRPPVKPSFKIKLYYCKCGSENEWKKRKVDGDDTIIGYAGAATNKFTFRSVNPILLVPSPCNSTHTK